MLTIIVAGERKERISIARDQYMHPDARLVPNVEGARWDDRDDSESIFGLVGVLRCSATRSGGTVERAWTSANPDLRIP